MKEKINIRPQAQNANAHTQRGMGELERSISQRGWIGAPTVAADGEAFDGSARFETGASLGFDYGEYEIIDAPEDRPIIVRSQGRQPVIHMRADIPTADDPRAKMLALEANKIAADNLSFDPVVFASLAEELDLTHLFHPEEMDLILEGMGQEETQAGGGGDDEEVTIDESQPTRCQPGDVWRVGEHVVACLDSTVRENIERVAKGVITFVIADPPYGIDIVSTDGLGTPDGSKPFGKVGTIHRGMKAKPIIEANTYAPVIGDDSTDTAIAAVLLSLKLFPHATQFWWGANNYAHVLPPSTCWIVWDKDNGESFFADAELAWSNHKSAVRIFKHMWNGLMKASERGERRVHPTQKPRALMRWLLERYGREGDVILDPFLGSGPVLKAAHELGGRKVVGFELSCHYIDHLLEWGESQGLPCSRAEGLTCERVVE